MAFVTGEPRQVDERPGDLPEDSLKQVMRDIEERKKRRQNGYRISEDNPRPEGPLPEGYDNLGWSRTENRWFCRAETETGEQRFQIWDKDKASWIEWAKFQEERQIMAPRGHRAMGDRSVPASFFRKLTTFFQRLA